MTRGARFVKKVSTQNNLKEEGKSPVDAEAMLMQALEIPDGFSFFFTFPKPSDYGTFESTAQAAHTVQSTSQEIHK